jgi:predicted transcriptional regulator
VTTVRDFTRWTDDELDAWLREQAAPIGLELTIEERPRADDGAPTVWFAALKDMHADPTLAPNGLALVGAEALSERWAKNGLAQLLDSLTDTERRRLVRQ